MGPKNVSHEEAEIVIWENLLRLARPQGIAVYSKKQGGFIRICVMLIISLQDSQKEEGRIT